jgi:hypothetical protein
MLCRGVSINSLLFAVSSWHVRDVDGRVKASLGWCRLLGGRVVNREDGLLGLLASFHLDVARDSLLFGHCCWWCRMCVYEEVGVMPCLSKWSSRVGQSRRPGRGRSR